jgi:hypothetical protein
MAVVGMVRECVAATLTYYLDISEGFDNHNRNQSNCEELAMSHFLTLVLVKRAELDPARKSHELMMPYFEFDVDNDVNKDSEDDDDDVDEDDGDNLSTKTKCDGFVIGGRYDGVIWGKEQHYNLSPTEFQKRYGFDVIRTEDNIRLISELVDDLVAYAIITPDGKWYDCEKKTKKEWLQEFRQMLKQHQDCIAVAIDCHC